MKCQCRNCAKFYESGKSRADFQGYCSAKCQHQKAKSFGYRKSGNRTEYQVLQASNSIGSVKV